MQRVLGVIVSRFGGETLVSLCARVLFIHLCNAGVLVNVLVWFPSAVCSVLVHLVGYFDVLIGVLVVSLRYKTAGILAVLIAFWRTGFFNMLSHQY